jgi:transcriptional regulator with XRE-family HTH domain
MTVGANIKNLRKERGLTQKQLADMLGIAPNTVAQYELGISQPKLEQLQKIAEALHVSVVSFLPDAWDYLSQGNTPEDTAALNEALNETEQERTQIGALRGEITSNQKQLANATKVINERIILKAINDMLIPLNRNGLLEAYKRVSELSEIKRYKR